MAKELVIPYLNFTLDKQDFDRTVRNVVAQVRPKWDKDNVTFEELTGGLICTLLCCRLKSDEHRRDALIIRIFEDTEFRQWINHESEIFGIAVGGHLGISQPLLAIACNGLVLGYARGQTLNYSALLDPEVVKLLTNAFAKLHSIEVEHYKVIDSRGQCYTIVKHDTRFDNMIKCVASIPEERFHDGLPSREELLEQIAKVREHWFTLGVPLVLTHNDAHTKNTIYSEEEGSIHLLDFDELSFERGLTDLLYNLGNREAFEIFGWATKNDPVITDDVIRMWAQFYVEGLYEAKGRKRSDVTNQDVQDMYESLCMVKGVTIFDRLIKSMMAGEDIRQMIDCDRMSKVSWTIYKKESERFLTASTFPASRFLKKEIVTPRK